MEFDVFSRVSEYHAIENYKGDSKWGSWIPMSDHPAADGIALVDGESNDSRKLFVAVRDFSEEDISLLKDPEFLISYKSELMERVISVTEKSRYICSADFGKVFSFDRRGICIEQPGEREPGGYDALLRYVPLPLLSSIYTQITGESPEKLNETVKELGLDIAFALQTFYSEDISYGCVSPENIMIDEDEGNRNYVLAIPLKQWFLDRTEKEQRYSAPELIENTSLEPYEKSDVYSLGLVMYGLLNNGRLPFEDNSTSQNDAIGERCKGAKEIPEPENGSPELKYVVRKALCYSPDMRYSGLSDFIADLKRAGTVLPGDSPMHFPERVVTVKKTAQPVPKASSAQPVNLKKPEPASPEPLNNSGNDNQYSKPDVGGFRNNSGGVNNTENNSNNGGYTGNNGRFSGREVPSFEPVRPNPVQPQPVPSPSGGKHSLLPIVIGLAAAVGIGIGIYKFILTKPHVQENLDSPGIIAATENTVPENNRNQADSRYADSNDGNISYEETGEYSDVTEAYEEPEEATIIITTAAEEQTIVVTIPPATVDPTIKDIDRSRAPADMTIEDAPVAKCKVITKEDPPNLRSEPSVSGGDKTVIGKIPIGWIVDVFGYNSKWCYVRYVDKYDQVTFGYVSREFVEFQ